MDRHAAGLEFDHEADERLVHEILGRLAVAARSEREREQLALMGVVDRSDQMRLRGSGRTVAEGRTPNSSIGSVIASTRDETPHPVIAAFADPRIAGP